MSLYAYEFVGEKGRKKEKRRTLYRSFFFRKFKMSKWMDSFTNSIRTKTADRLGVTVNCFTCYNIAVMCWPGKNCRMEVKL